MGGLLQQKAYSQQSALSFSLLRPREVDREATGWSVMIPPLLWSAGSQSEDTMNKGNPLFAAVSNRGLPVRHKQFA